MALQVSKKNPYLSEPSIKLSRIPIVNRRLSN
jgi:hypothetical protein